MDIRKNRTIKLYTILLLFSLTVCSCANNNETASSETTPPTEEIVPTKTETPTSTKSTTPTETEVSFVPKYGSIPDGVYLTYYDWEIDELRVLTDSDSGQYPVLASHNGNISYDGKQLTFIEDNELVMVNLVDGTIITIPLPINCKGFPSWSPDGDRLVMGCENNIYVFNIEYETLDLLTNWAQQSVDSFRFPQWSPDGKWVACSYRQLSSLQFTSDDGVYLIEVDCIEDESNCQDRTRGVYFPNSQAMIISWSRDSHYLAVFDNNRSIRMVDISTNEIRELMTDPNNVNGLAWYPDGNWLVYSIGKKIYKVSSQGGEPTLLAEDKGYVNSWIEIISE
jgi:Tol biopolymer transport system component